MLPYAIHNFANTVVRAAKDHPVMAIGLGGVGVLFIVALVKNQNSASGGVPLLPAGLPGGPLPAGTTGLTSYLPDAFFVGVHAMGDHMRSRGATVTDEDLMAIMMAESDVKANVPNRVNGVCLGLNQICPLGGGKPVESGLRAVGFQGSLAEYSALSETQQLPFMQKYFDNRNAYPAMRNVGSLYLANFSPAFLGKPDDFVMYRPEGITHGTKFFGPEYYRDNAFVDSNPKKGFITVGDMPKFVLRSITEPKHGAPKWNELRMRLQKVTGGVLIAGILHDNPFNCVPMPGGGFALHKNARIENVGWAPAAGACPHCRAAAGCLCSRTCSGGMTG